LEDREYDGRIELKSIKRKWTLRVGVDENGSRLCSVAGFYISGVEPSGFLELEISKQIRSEVISTS
jgi:hypothetical protein